MEFEILCKIIAEVLSVDTKELNMETTFMEDLGADSLDLYQILLKAEEEFKIKADTSKIDEVYTVGEALALIQQFR